MNYDFTTEINRFNTRALKWLIADDELPLWVADMDFETAPAIVNALHKRVDHKIFGYTRVDDTWRDAYRHWWSRRYGWEIRREDLLFATGIMPGLHSAVRRFTAPGDKVAIITPVYHCFFEAVEENGRFVAPCPLDCVEGEYRLNFERLEATLAEPGVEALIFCNPHNPTGQLWTREELIRVGELAHKYGIIVLNDEIHCDLVDPGYTYVPFASASETCEAVSINFLSPSKSFNIPGLASAAVVIRNPQWRTRMARALHADQIGNPNALAVDPVIAAYEEGEAWLEELRQVLAHNKARVVEFIEKEIPELKTHLMPATYLVWIDCSAITENTNALVKHLRQTEGLILSAGSAFRGNGITYLRLNPATQATRLEDALARLKRGVASFKAAH